MFLLWWKYVFNVVGVYIGLMCKTAVRRIVEVSETSATLTYATRIDGYGLCGDGGVLKLYVVVVWVDLALIMVCGDVWSESPAWVG